MCRYYVEKRCRHGSKGTGCCFDHPVKCFRFMRNGSHAKRGCTKGKDCNYFHPPLCRTSINSGVCSKENCRLHHIKGTKFTDGWETETGYPYREKRLDTNPHQNSRRATSTNKIEAKAEMMPKIRVLQRPSSSYANILTTDGAPGAGLERDPHGSGQTMDNSQNFLEINRQIQQMQLQIEKILKTNLGHLTATNVCRCQAICQ